jgi:hypothetical protein
MLVVCSFEFVSSKFIWHNASSLVVHLSFTSGLDNHNEIVRCGPL